MTGERVQVPEKETDVMCEKCGRPMVIKTGRYGKFLACPGYPQCKNTRPLVSTVSGSCPKCGGTLVERKSKRNRVFYGCAGYPKCDFATWNEPTKETCPTCGKTLFKKVGRGGNGLVCLGDGCGYEQALPKGKDK